MVCVVSRCRISAFVSSCNAVLSIYTASCHGVHSAALSCTGASLRHVWPLALVDTTGRSLDPRRQFGSHIRIRPPPSRCARHCSFSAASSNTLHNVGKPHSNNPSRSSRPPTFFRLSLFCNFSLCPHLPRRTLLWFQSQRHALANRDVLHFNQCLCGSGGRPPGHGRRI